jgi:hypothetical protein
VVAQEADAHVTRVRRPMNPQVCWRHACRLCEVAKDRDKPQKIVARSQIVLLAGDRIGAAGVAMRVGKSVIAVRR